MTIQRTFGPLRAWSHAGFSGPDTLAPPAQDDAEALSQMMAAPVDPLTPAGVPDALTGFLERSGERVSGRFEAALGLLTQPVVSAADALKAQELAAQALIEADLVRAGGQKIVSSLTELARLA